MDSKYGNRKFLCEYNLSTDFLEHVGLKPKDIFPIKKGYILECENGVFYMKKIYSEDNIRILKNLIENSNEFSEDYNIFVANDLEELYYFLNIPSNTICNLNNMNDLKNIAKKLASVHKNCTEREMSLLREIKEENIKEEFNMAFDNILFYKKIVDGYIYKSKFDELFIENIEWILKQINITTNEVMEFNYNDICREERLKCLCLGNIEVSNILIKDDKCYFVDIEDSYLGIGAINLAKFLFEILRYLNYDIEKGKEIIEAYNEVRPISNIEFKIMYSYLNYPKNLIELVCNYYNKNQMFDESIFINKFNKVLELRDEKNTFIKWFYDEYVEI